MKDGYLGWKEYGHRRCSSGFLSYCSSLFARVAATWLPFNNSGSSLHAWPVLLVTFSHLITSSSLCKWSKVCKELQRLLLDRLIYLEGGWGRRGRENEKLVWLEALSFFSNHINWSNTRYYFSQQLVLLISLDCHDYLFCYSNDSILSLSGWRAAFLLSAHLHWCLSAILFTSHKKFHHSS